MDVNLRQLIDTAGPLFSKAGNIDVDYLDQGIAWTLTNPPEDEMYAIALQTMILRSTNTSLPLSVLDFAEWAMQHKSDNVRINTPLVCERLIKTYPVRGNERMRIWNLLQLAADDPNEHVRKNAEIVLGRNSRFLEGA